MGRGVMGRVESLGIPDNLITPLLVSVPPATLGRVRLSRGVFTGWHPREHESHKRFLKIVLDTCARIRIIGT